VRVGAFNYYPGIFKDRDGVVKGFYVDALADIARRENIRFEYVYGTWSEGLARLKAGTVDVLTSVAFTPERSVYMEYAKTPLLTVWGELYVRPESEIDGIREVRGKTIAVMKDDVNARHFVEMVRKFDIPCRFVELPGFEEVFRAIAAKQVDAGVVNSTFGVPKQKEYGLRTTGVIFNPFDIFFTVAKGRNRDLLALLDGYLHNWRHQDDSVYNKARQKWAHGSSDTM
jgi:ABC-type amino acid transport substrate-binding protein